jgi:hypothetical protein
LNVEEKFFFYCATGVTPAMSAAKPGREAACAGAFRPKARKSHERADHSRQGM